MVNVSKRNRISHPFWPGWVSACPDFDGSTCIPVNKLQFKFKIHVTHVTAWRFRRSTRPRYVGYANNRDERDQTSFDIVRFSITKMQSNVTRNTCMKDMLTECYPWSKPVIPKFHRFKYCIYKIHILLWIYSFSDLNTMW